MVTQLILFVCFVFPWSKYCSFLVWIFSILPLNCLDHLIILCLCCFLSCWIFFQCFLVSILWRNRSLSTSKGSAIKNKFYALSFWPTWVYGVHHIFIVENILLIMMSYFNTSNEVLTVGRAALICVQRWGFEERIYFVHWYIFLAILELHYY